MVDYRPSVAGILIPGLVQIGEEVYVNEHHLR
jgi:hypothetical protein